MAVPEKIVRLVERFDENIASYKQGKYNETQTRREFIDPFFKSLGWDIDNESGQSELNKEVIHEDAITVEHATKAPDYCFRLGGVRKFFVEAKKPSVDIKGDTHPAYQLRRYGWSAKLPLSILTDFEEFAVYDCRIMPEKTDKAGHARLLYLTYSEYLQQWETIVNAFSREAVLSGAFDQYADAHKDKRGTLEVDVAFLQEIERWREQLAQNFALRNPGITRRELNYAVQRTIDRMIFLRICEDRGIEPYGKLQTLQEQNNIYGLLLKRFYEADARYNSGIFHFKNEREHQEQPDTLTPNLTIDDDVLKSILKKLYYPDSPYAFEVIPAEILGQVYEQFLGKVICLDTTHRATVEEKPEVKKAGGVYYTPAYIVEYIVTRTIGEFLTGKTPKQAEILTVLDPACGSGSFLIGAYQYLLDWHRAQYIADDPKKWSKGKRPRLYQIGNDWKLTIDERKRILLTHIYGVDIDSQAVEVTKLSLLLKVLEGENEQSISSQMALFHERVLPNLASNIKCGNSLISTDFYIGKQQSLIDEEERERVNTFDWKNEYSHIIQDGKFNIVIGNPPYGMVTHKEEKLYFTGNYQSVEGRFDKYELFIEKGINLCNDYRGVLGFIIPSPLLSNIYTRKLRQYILTNCNIKEITNFGIDVFTNPTVHTCIIIISKDNSKQSFVNIRKQVLSIHDLTKDYDYKSPQSLLGTNKNTTFDIFIDPEIQNLITKMSENSQQLGDICFIRQCIKTGDDEKYVVSTTEHLTDPWKMTLRGRAIGRYRTLDKTLYLKYGEWLARNWKNKSFYETPKIAVRETGDRIVATVDLENRYFLSSLYAIYYKNSEQADSVEYLLGILNSLMATFFVKKVALELTKGAFTKFRTNQLHRLPIHCINFSSKEDKNRHNKMRELVNQILYLNDQLSLATTPQTQTTLKRQIESTDQQIDQLVYELYGLTEEEIKIVEAGA